MNDQSTPDCASCETRLCMDGEDCFGDADRQRTLYEDPQLSRLHRAASAIEARHYCKETRIREIMLFAKELGYSKLGLAFCVGLASEAEIVAEIFAREFEVVSVCCKLCGIAKRNLGFEQIRPDLQHETMCNPAGQATMLNEAETQLNVLCGLCVGHDSVFTMVSRAPVTTLIVKDRVLAHNPVAALYCQYIRRTMLPEDALRRER